MVYQGCLKFRVREILAVEFCRENDWFTWVLQVINPQVWEVSNKFQNLFSQNQDLFLMFRSRMQNSHNHFQFWDLNKQVHKNKLAHKNGMSPTNFYHHQLTCPHQNLSVLWIILGKFVNNEKLMKKFKKIKIRLWKLSERNSSSIQQDQIIWQIWLENRDLQLQN